MIKLYIENIVTDLRKSGIRLSQDAFDAINEIIDIQNSTVSKFNAAKWQDLKGKTVIFAQDGDVKAIYNKDKFMYNPVKAKISNALDYDLYEIDVQGTHVQNRRQQRRDTLSGLRGTKDSPYSGTPTSSSYIWEKDWDPAVNQRYYSKLLQRNHLERYAQELNDAYEIVKQLIDQRKDRLTGKRSEYDRFITDISKQIMKIEDEMTAAERDYGFDVEKLKKEISKLPALISKAKIFLQTEEDEYKAWGKRKKIPYTAITK